MKCLSQAIPRRYHALATTNLRLLLSVQETRVRARSSAGVSGTNGRRLCHELHSRATTGSITQQLAPVQAASPWSLAKNTLPVTASILPAASATAAAPSPLLAISTQGRTWRQILRPTPVCCGSTCRGYANSSRDVKLVDRVALDVRAGAGGAGCVSVWQSHAKGEYNLVLAV